jgi:AraC-like DNA-binding protein
MTFFATIVLLGALQGFITSILLFRKQNNKLAERLLGTLILLISLACLNIYFLETKLNFDSNLWHILRAIIPMIVIMPVGPLIYFYTKVISQSKQRFSEQDKLHFIPILLDIVPEISVFIFVAGVSFGLLDSELQSPLSEFIDSYNKYIDIPRWFSISIYLYLSFKEIRKLPSTSKIDISLDWSWQLLVGFSFFQLTWLVFLIPYIIPATSNTLLDFAGWYPVYIPLTVLVYWLCIRGYLMNSQIAKPTFTSELSEKEISNTIQKLEKAMKANKLFLNPTLQLADVIEKTSIPQKQISAVLNQHLGKSFNEYVNSFRVEEFKKKLLDKNHQHLTITGIALECGFNSQATFQRAFKAQEGKPPSQFRKEKLSEEKIKKTLLNPRFE